MAVERTLVLIKPDAMQRQLAGEILVRFERRGLLLRDAKLIRVDRHLAETHYAEHAEKPFYEACPGSIRGQFALSMPDNLVHGSDSPESAQRELQLWFGD